LDNQIAQLEDVAPDLQEDKSITEESKVGTNKK
jgi:hypothetical protein